MAEAVASELAVPESGGAGAAVPERAVPESAVPEPVVPELAVPESAVPESAVPESVVPESAVPELAVSESAVSELGRCRSWCRSWRRGASLRERELLTRYRRPCRPFGSRVGSHGETYGQRALATLRARRRPRGIGARRP